MAQIKLKKTLYVGLGGTGVSVLLNVKKCFIDTYGEIPPMIKFLAIDTDGAAKNKEISSNRNIPIRLEDSELLVCTVKQALDVYNNNIHRYDWVPSKNVKALSSIKGQGAGQVRSNGRFIAYYNFQRIQDFVSNAITAINKDLPMKSKFAVDLDSSGVQQPCLINVFSSVAGGTGSGMLVDTLCLIDNAVKALAMNVRVYPWLLLPEIFKNLGAGPEMKNVLYNTYGALRTLDYMQHLDPASKTILDLGYQKMQTAPFDYAYIINNFNKAGAAFTRIEDIVEAIAKSAFLPSNTMGDALDSPFDNIVNSKNGGNFVIRNKVAWAASTSSAELVYDNQAVGRAYAHRILSQLCLSLITSDATGVKEANDFVDHADVMIRENNGENQVIDTLLPQSAPGYQLTIERDTTKVDVENYITYNTDVNRLNIEIGDNYKRKLDNTKQRFDERMKAMLDESSDGCIGKTISFIDSLQGIIDACLGEMEKEQKDYHDQNTIPLQLDADLNSCKNSGLKVVLGKPIDEDACNIFQQKLSQIVTNHREELRRVWAIRFYNDLTGYLQQKRQKVENLKVALLALSDEHKRALLNEQQNAESVSKFQIYLHKEDIYQVPKYSIEDTLKVHFRTYFSKHGNLSSWKSLSKEQLDEQLWEYVKTAPIVTKVVNHSIDEVLRKLNETNPDILNSYLIRLKELAAPLWTYNTQGYTETDYPMSRFTVVGLNNRDTDLLSTSADYKEFYDEGQNKANFVSTHQNDRIYVMVVESLLPIYAVNNFSTYKRDTDDKEAKDYAIANYIDEKLYKRMQSEGFSLLPKQDKDNLLETWVYSCIMGYIHFDEDKETYWIRSRAKGSPIKDFRYDLARQRDVAFDMFKSEGLVDEMETLLNKKIAKEGHDAFESKIEDIKENASYMAEYSRLSKLERENLEHPNFDSVRKLLEREIEFMSIF